MYKKLMVLLVVALVLLFAGPTAVLAGKGAKPYKETHLWVGYNPSSNPNDYIAGNVTYKISSMYFVDELGQEHSNRRAKGEGIVYGYECPVEPIECMLSGVEPVPTGEQWLLRYESLSMGKWGEATVGRSKYEVTLEGLNGTEDIQFGNCRYKLTINGEGRVVVDRLSCDD